MTAARAGGQDGEVGEGARRIRRDRMSPIEGPPRHLRISDELPPSSDIGRMKVVVMGEKVEQMAFPGEREKRRGSQFGCR